MMSLKQELEQAGCKMDVDDFNDLLQETFTVSYPTETVAWLLRRPESEGHKFLTLIRRKAHCGDLPDYVILGALENCRQAGQLSLHDRADS